MRELSCSASQYAGLSEGITFGWYRNENGVDSDIVLDSWVTNSSKNDGMGSFTGILKFASVNRLSTGSIKCRAFNNYGASNLSSATSVNVKCEMFSFHVALEFVKIKRFVLLDAPESVEISPSDPVGVKGQSITLNCSAVGNPSPFYEWRGNKRTTGFTLKLTSLGFEDEGTYTCVASNTIEAGSMSSNSSVRLQIEGKVQFIC